jgi:hypothetical protein
MNILRCDRGRGLRIALAPFGPSPWHHPRVEQGCPQAFLDSRGAVVEQGDAREQTLPRPTRPHAVTQRGPS